MPMVEKFYSTVLPIDARRGEKFHSRTDLSAHSSIIVFYRPRERISRGRNRGGPFSFRAQAIPREGKVLRESLRSETGSCRSKLGGRVGAT